MIEDTDRVYGVPKNLFEDFLKYRKSKKMNYSLVSAKILTLGTEFPMKGTEGPLTLDLSKDKILIQQNTDPIATFILTWKKINIKAIQLKDAPQNVKFIEPKNRIKVLLQFVKEEDAKHFCEALIERTPSGTDSSPSNNSEWSSSEDSSNSNLS